MKRNFFFPSLVAMVTLLSISSIGATYAWYQYQTFVSADFGGTSIAATKVFQVGLVSDIELDCSTYGLTYEKIDNKNVYWVSGEVSTNIADHYLEMNGYGTHALNGVTSGKYEPTASGDSFSLKEAPVSLSNYFIPGTNVAKSALKTNYLSFSFAFKTNQIVADGVETDLTESGIALSNFEFESHDSELNRAVRIHFHDEARDNGFVFNPSSEDDGFIEVGGALDLLGDGVYDVYRNTNGEVAEYVYGEYETLNYKTEPTSDGVDFGVAKSNNNCFVAKHQNGAYAIDEETTVWSKSYYEGLKTVVGNKKSLATTNSDGIAYFDMDIYLEGWDMAFTNDMLNKTFGCSVEFQSL